MQGVYACGGQGSVAQPPERLPTVWAHGYCRWGVDRVQVPQARWTLDSGRHVPASMGLAGGAGRGAPYPASAAARARLRDERCL